MAFIKRTWLARIGTGLNKFIIGEKDANDKQTLVNSPDSVTQQGDVISAENLNDLEGRIETAFGADSTRMGNIETSVSGMKLTKVWENDSPSTPFDGQTVNLSEMADEVLVAVGEYLLNNTYSNATKLYHMKMVGGVFEGSYSKRISAEGTYFTKTTSGGSFEFMRRQFVLYTESGVSKMKFDDCERREIKLYQGVTTMDEVVDNYYLIPFAIYKVGDIYNS